MIERIFDWNLPVQAQQFLNVILIWLGFALLVGFLAQLIVPSRKTRGTLVTIIVGLTGSCLGSLVVSRISPGENFNPIGLAGFLASLGTAIALLSLFHVFMFIFPPSKNNGEDKE